MVYGFISIVDGVIENINQLTVFFSAAICSSCSRTTLQQQLSVSRMEKQDEKEKK